MDNSAPFESFPSPREQAERLIERGVPAILAQTPEQIRNAADELQACTPGELLLVPTSIPCGYSSLMPLVRYGGKEGFVVEDFSDAADFVAVSGESSEPIELPGGGWYALVNPQRGDEFSNASPAEALDVISQSGDVALTIAEGIFWLLQCPDVLERNHCFMTIGSRKPKPMSKTGFDSRTPALWISNGTGRDGAENKNAPKLGWCWWNNRHTWLGIAHASGRVAPEVEEARIVVPQDDLLAAVQSRIGN
ncbi:DUF5701 family protein [Actinomycetaceae bacterium L2_0104]